MSMAVFGGTFDPPNKGHTKLVSAVCSQLGLGRCLIIPTNIPPHKQQATGGASAADRLAMAALCDWGVPAQVSDIELARTGKSYTYDTLVQLRALYPGEKFYFLLGSDMLYYFKKWHRWQELLGLATFCAAARNAADRAGLQAFADELTAQAGGEILLFDFPPVEISSSALRQSLAAGTAVGAYLDPAVASYINTHHLYRQGASV